MMINKVNSTNFKAKLVRTPIFNEAVASAKNTNNNTKYAFYNAINVIHEDFGFKKFQIDKVESAKQQLRPLFKLIAEENNGDSFTFVTNLSDAENEGQSAVTAIIDFISKCYGKRTAQYIKLSRKCAPDELNERIDGILYRNQNRYGSN